MPTYRDYPEFNENEIHSRFAVLPLTDMNGNTLFFESYWEYGSWCEIGFFVLRGSKKLYPTKSAFWSSVRFRIPTLIEEVYKR